MATKTSSKKNIALIPAPQIECPEKMEVKIGDKSPAIISAEMNSKGDAVVVTIKLFVGSPVGEKPNCGTVTLPDSVTIDGVDYWVNCYNPWKWSKAGKRYKDGRQSISLTPKMEKVEDKKVVASEIPF
jgi:hypothetical protein